MSETYDTSKYPNDVLLDLVYAPKSFAVLDPEQNGRWYLLELPKGRPAGYVWTNGSDAAGFLPLDAGKYPAAGSASSNVSGMLHQLAADDIPAVAAYQTLAHLPVAAVSSEFRGKLGVLLSLSRNMNAPVPSALVSSPVVSAAEATPSSDVEDTSLFAALDDSGNVVELGQSTPDGVYLRSNGAWWKLPNDDTTFDGLVWQDVSPEAVQIFDQSDAQGQRPTPEALKKYSIDASE